MRFHIPGGALHRHRQVPRACWDKERLAGTVFVGELGQDGRLRPVPGVLPSVVGAAAAGFARAVVPPENAAEALLVPGRECFGAEPRRADRLAAR